MKAYLPEVGYGLTLALAVLIWNTLEYLLGFHTTRIAWHSTVTNGIVGIHIFLVWHALRHRRDVLEGGQLLWWQGMASGMIVSVIAGILGAPTMWIFSKIVNPGFYQAMIEYSVQTGMKRELAEVNFHPTVYAFEATLSPILLGFFVTVILTAIARWQVDRQKNTPAASPS